ncbi:MAG: Ig-like domain-containing protein [Bacteroidales bacterium]|nr:Ig-like domain-containing protein [Bacteroidales bacterium]
MKRLSIYCMALAVFVLGSCSMEQESIVPEEIPGMKFTAVWSDEASRTSLDENGTSVLWDPGDEIFIFQGVTAGGPSAMGKFTSTNTAPQSTATFTGTLEGEGIGDYIAVYPYYEFHEQGTAMDISEMGFGVGTIVGHMLNPVQKGVEGSFDTRTAPAAAISSTNELVFHNICGGVRFSVSRSGIEKVVFTSVDGTPMSGPTYITFDGDGVAVIPSDWMKEMGETPSLPFVEVVAPEGGFVPGKNYYAIMWPYTHAEGIKVTLYGDGVKAERTLSGPVTVKRSVFGKIDNIDSGLEYVPTTPVPEIVDLGLSVKWASFNLGASAPEEYGDYFAWGETAPRSIYGISYFYEFYDLVYKWYKGEDGRLTKYCNNSEYGYNGFTDNKTVLDPEDDAATVNLGGNWRMPTLLEYQELLKNCTGTRTTINGVNGMKFTSNKSGYTDRWIFLPAAGVRDVTYLFYPGEYGNYWSSTLENDDPYYAYDLFFESEYRMWNGSFMRSYGLPVRPVYGPPAEVIPVTGVELNESSLQLYKGATAQLTATVTPEDASNKQVVWSSSDESIATVSENGVVSGVGVGTAEISVTTVDGGFTATCTITVIYPDLTELGKTFVAVNLGLSVKWASFNLGATTPEGYGNYYAWGEIVPKEIYYWSNYKFCSSSSWLLLKYCTSSSFGTVDNKAVLDPEDDAATVALGGSWRMATYDEWDELKTKCTWTWTTQNGVEGRLVTGPNGNRIFLPAAGIRVNADLECTGSYGYYWSSSLSTDNPRSAHDVVFDSDGVDWYDNTRSGGFSIRPVTE